MDTLARSISRLSSSSVPSTLLTSSSALRFCRQTHGYSRAPTYCFANSRILTSSCIQTHALISHTTRFGKWSRVSVVASAKNVSSKEKGGLSTAKTETETETEVPAEYEYIKKKLLGGEPDLWEGQKWNVLGFLVQYLWAFGILVALVACGIAVRTYNFGASDFRDTPAFKEALQTQGELDTAPEADSEDSADPLLLDAPPL